MVKALFDTNILIDYLNGIGASKKEFARYEYRAMSAITWMEVLVGTTAEDEAAIRAWLDTFDVIAVDSAIANRAVEIRRTSGFVCPMRSCGRQPRFIRCCLFRAIRRIFLRMNPACACRTNLRKSITTDE